MLGSATTLPDQLTASITATHDTLLRTTGKSANKSVDDFVSDQSYSNTLSIVYWTCGCIAMSREAVTLLASVYTGVQKSCGFGLS